MTRITKPSNPTVRTGGGKANIYGSTSPAGRSGGRKGTDTAKPKASTDWKPKAASKPAASKPTVRSGGGKANIYGVPGELVLPKSTSGWKAKK